MKQKTFNLHFTDFCNFKCKHCFVNKQGKELTLEEIKLIVDKLADYSKYTGINIRINLAGGEPLISKNIQTIIDYIYSKGIQISIITNGYFLTEEFLCKNKNKLSMIGLSIDSFSHDTNVLIGRCENDKTISKTEMIDKCLLIKKVGIKLKINICISSNNINEDFYDFLQSVTPDRIKILRVLCDHNFTLKSISISDYDWKKTQEKYEKLNPVYEDNSFMRTGYLIIDSDGNLSKNNLHHRNNSVLHQSIAECLEDLNKQEED